MDLLLRRLFRDSTAPSKVPGYLGAAGIAESWRAGREDSRQAPTPRCTAAPVTKELSRFFYYRYKLSHASAGWPVPPGRQGCYRSHDVPGTRAGAGSAYCVPPTRVGWPDVTQRVGATATACKGGTAEEPTVTTVRDRGEALAGCGSETPVGQEARARARSEREGPTSCPGRDFAHARANEDGLAGISIVRRRRRLDSKASDTLQSGLTRARRFEGERGFNASE